MHPINVMIAIYSFLILVYLGIMAFRLSKNMRRFFLLGWTTPKIIGTILLRFLIWIAAGVLLFLLLAVVLLLLSYIVSPPRPPEDLMTAQSLISGARSFAGETLRLKG